jgi:hypothetical protein
MTVSPLPLLPFSLTATFLATMAWSLSIQTPFPLHCRMANKSCSSFTRPAFLNNGVTNPQVFVPPTQRIFKLHASIDEEMSSYDIDEDEAAEQTLATNGANGEVPHTIYDEPVNGYKEVTASQRYSDTLRKFSLSLPTLANLPSSRPISSHGVFCNRELRVDNLKAVGFDMDYTLAQYQQPAFDKLAFDGAKEKLVHSLGYPEEVLDFEYDHTYWVRGLIIDTQRGNFLKIDRHKYVRVACKSEFVRDTLQISYLVSTNFSLVHYKITDFNQSPRI